MTISELRLVDFVDTGALTATADASGTCLLLVATVPPGHKWRVVREMFSSDSKLAGTVALYLGDADRQGNLRLTPKPGSAQTILSDSLTVMGNTDINVLWMGLTPGARCVCVLQYDVFLVVTMTSDTHFVGGGPVGLAPPGY